MPETRIKPIDLSSLQVGEAITFAKIQSSGRRFSMSVNIREVLGGHAYGTVLAAEQAGAGSGPYHVYQSLSANLARLPLEGVIGETPYPLDVHPIWHKLIPPQSTQSALESVEWRPIIVEFDELYLQDISLGEGAVYPHTADLPQVVVSGSTT